MIRRDAFDSDLLGKRCGIISGGYGGDWGIDRLQPWDHVRVAIPLNSTPSYSYDDVRKFENLGFHTASIRGTFEGTVLAMGTYDQVRQPTDEEAEAIVAGASKIFLHSRFNTDPFYKSTDYQKIHEAWLARLLNERCLLVAGPFGAPRGFVGFSRVQEGPKSVLDIELIGALDSKPGSGRHVLSSLVVEEKTHHVRAKTQLSNLPAVGMYQAIGMKLVKTEAILTWSRS